MPYRRRYRRRYGKRRYRRSRGFSRRYYKGRFTRVSKGSFARTKRRRTNIYNKIKSIIAQGWQKIPQSIKDRARNEAIRAVTTGAAYQARRGLPGPNNLPIAFEWA